MDVLTAFIREHSREPWPASDPGGRERPRSTRPDVQAAVTVICRRDAKHDIDPINLEGADLIGADLGEAILARAALDGADLTGAYLNGANLDGASLFRVILGNANLGATRLGADLEGADLTWADLTEAYLTGADLIGANLTDARWPDGAPVPEGWRRDGSGRLKGRVPTPGRQRPPSRTANPCSRPRGRL